MQSRPVGSKRPTRSIRSNFRSRDSNNDHNKPSGVVSSPNETTSLGSSTTVPVNGSVPYPTTASSVESIGTNANPWSNSRSSLPSNTSTDDALIASKSASTVVKSNEIRSYHGVDVFSNVSAAPNSQNYFIPEFDVRADLQHKNLNENGRHVYFDNGTDTAIHGYQNLSSPLTSTVYNPLTFPSSHAQQIYGGSHVVEPSHGSQSASNQIGLCTVPDKDGNSAMIPNDRNQYDKISVNIGLSSNSISQNSFEGSGESASENYRGITTTNGMERETRSASKNDKYVRKSHRRNIKRSKSESLFGISSATYYICKAVTKIATAVPQYIRICRRIKVSSHFLAAFEMLHRMLSDLNEKKDDASNEHRIYLKHMNKNRVTSLENDKIRRSLAFKRYADSYEIYLKIMTLVCIIIFSSSFVWINVIQSENSDPKAIAPNAHSDATKTSISSKIEFDSNMIIHDTKFPDMQKLSHYRKLKKTLPYYTPALLVPSRDVKNNYLEHLKDLQDAKTVESFSVNTNTTSSTREKSSTSHSNVNEGDVATVKQYPVLHIVKTRFMQEQGSLIALSEARLALFKVFCLPTMMKQTTKNFIWIIRVDPALNHDVLQQLIEAVLMERDYPIANQGAKKHTDVDSERSTISNTNFRGNVYIVGSNTNYHVVGDKVNRNVTTPGGWRDGAEPNELSSANTKIYTGNQTVLEWYMSLEGNFPILETRLDCDDGLHVGFLHAVQKMAYDQFASPSESSSSNEIRESIVDIGVNGKPQEHFTNIKWMYWCSRRHIEWHWTDPLHHTYPELNTKDDSLTQMISMYGAIQGIQHKKLCIATGITTGYNIGTRDDIVPVYSHDELFAKIKEADTNSDVHDRNCGAINNSDCLQFVETFLFEAIRSRAPTSAGMLRIQPSYEELQHQHSWWVTYAFWNMLHTSFGNGITRTSLSWINKYLSIHLVDIATDNLRGQCTSGHSCKDSARKELQLLLDKVQGERAK